MSWIRRFIVFYDRRHPETMGESEVTAHISYLAMKKGVSAPTQNQALSAIIFLYRNILDRELELMEITRAKIRSVNRWFSPAPKPPMSSHGLEGSRGTERH